MSTGNSEVVSGLWAALAREDVEAQIALCGQRMEILNPPEFPVTGPFRGHDGLRQWAAEIWEVFDDLDFEVQEIIEADDGETLVSVQRTTGRMRHTQIPVDIVWAAVWTVRSGKAVSSRGFLTRAEALEAAGLPE